MQLILDLSKETCNSYAELIKQPMHIVIGLYNALRKSIEKENKAREDAEKRERAKQNFSMPSMSMPSIPSMRMPN